MSKRSTLFPLGSKWHCGSPLEPEHTHRWALGGWAGLPVAYRTTMRVGVVTILGYGKEGTLILSTSPQDPPFTMDMVQFQAISTPCGPYGGTRPDGNGVTPKVRRRRNKLRKK